VVCQSQQDWMELTRGLPYGNIQVFISMLPHPFHEKAKVDKKKNVQPYSKFSPILKEFDYTPDSVENKNLNIYQ
jgi:hypothetical protein